MQREWIEESFELIASSDPRNGAVPLTAEGDRFEVLFDEPIGIPKGAIDPIVQCMGADIWWTIPNIMGNGPGANNRFGFSYSQANYATGTVVIDANNNRFGIRYRTFQSNFLLIPVGTYQIPDLEAAMIDAMFAAEPAFPRAEYAQWFRLTMNAANGQTTIVLNAATVPPSGPSTYIEWGYNDAFPNIGPGVVLGWPLSFNPVNLDGPYFNNTTFNSPAPARAGVTVQAQGLAIPPGLYNIDQLEAQVKLLMVANGLTEIQADKFINFTGDESRQLTIVTLTCSFDGGPGFPCYFEFGVNGLNGFERLLGFNDWLPPPVRKVLVGVYPESTFTGSSVASFNTLNYLLLHTDLVPRGIRFNGDFAQIVAQVPVNVNTGNQIVYEPQHPPLCDGANLVGAQRTKATFWITNDVNQPVDTFGEYWSLRLLIKYRITKGL